MIKIREAVVVEGRYDKHTISQVVDAPILMTNGFGIMKDKAQLELLRQVAQRRGLIIFTDADGAGFVIRNFLKGVIPGQYLKHAYIPDIYGKERRKNAPGKEGKLGVEGMPKDVIVDCLSRAGATIEGETSQPLAGQITKQDFALLGLSGGAYSSYKRKQLRKATQMPEHMSCNAMLQAVNLLYTKEEFAQFVTAQTENQYG